MVVCGSFYVIIAYFLFSTFYSLFSTFAVQSTSMTIHKEGYKSIVIAAIIFAVINLASFYFISFYWPWLSWLIFIVTLGLVLFIISFFRVPNRQLTKGDKLVICPADGKVVVIEETVAVEYF